MPLPTIAPRAIPMPQRFSASPTIDGYEVVDSDGRPVVETRSTLREANGAAQNLNRAAFEGTKQLLRALRAA